MHKSLAVLVAVVVSVAASACKRELAPVDVSDVLRSCTSRMENAQGVVVSCNDDVVVGALDLPAVGDKRAYIQAVVGGIGAVL